MMLKKLMLIAVFTALVTGVSFAQPDKPATSKPQPANQAQPSGLSSETEKNTCCKTDKIVVVSDTRPPYEQSDVWLVIVGIITCCVVFWQSRQTRKAADAAKENAGAAKLNAQALVNSERPWLIAEVISQANNSGNYEVQITNYGRTPARFIRGDSGYLYTVNPSALISEPVYDSPIRIPTQTLVATDKGFPIPCGYDMRSLDSLSGGADRMLVIYGRIVYEDVIIPGIEHETRWCFSCNLPIWRIVTSAGNLDQDPKLLFQLAGSGNYTKHT